VSGSGAVGRKKKESRGKGNFIKEDNLSKGFVSFS
jgi:hypothetical protein